MNDFVSNNIFHNHEYLAKELYRTRTEKNISLAKAAQKTGISQKYLAALETGEFNKLPAGVYVRKFLSEYALYLGLDVNEILAIYDEAAGRKESEKTEKIFIQKTSKINYYFNFPKILKGFFIILTVFICVAYLGIYLRKIVLPPKLTLIKPIENLTTDKNIMEIAGTTEREAEVKINEETVLVDNNGNFSKEINLKNGLNVILVSAKKKYSKTNEISRKIYVEPENIAN